MIRTQYWIWKILQFAILYQYTLHGEVKATEMYNCSAMIAVLTQNAYLNHQNKKSTIIMLDYLQAIMQMYFSFDTYFQFFGFSF
jgi:hypothetical protein